jgi:hypothetical protein
MRSVIGVLVFLAALTVAVLVAIFHFIVPGVSDVIAGLEDPQSAKTIVWGVAQIWPLSLIVLWAIVAAGGALAGAIGYTRRPRKSLSRSGRFRL